MGGGRRLHSKDSRLPSSGFRLPFPIRKTERDPLWSTLQDCLLLEAWWRNGSSERARGFAQQLLESNPALVAPRLLLADRLAAEGEIVEAMGLLHTTRTADPGGRVARRLERPLLTLAFSTPPGASVMSFLRELPPAVQAAVAGGEVWQAPAAFSPSSGPEAARAKRLPRGDEPSPQLREIQQELVKLQAQVYRHRPAKTRTALATAEAIVVAREPLVRLYGEDAADAILGELAGLSQVMDLCGVVRPHLLVLDDPATLAPWKLPAAHPLNAATVKATLDRLEESMEATGERLAYVLLVGGHEVIPHHQLPNPVDDHDPDVPSDNPYATRGDNYLIPSRAVGRLPHERTSPDLLLQQIRRLRAAWREQALFGKGLFGDLMANLLEWVPPRLSTTGESWGFSAQVWARAAEAVLRTLDREATLTLCPPTTSAAWEREPLPTLPFYYFNLHGVEENARWYGQANPTDPLSMEAYPVALTPAQMNTLSLERAIIFSEACYGANPYNPVAADSMALTALKQGCSLYVGSTNTSYATFAPPLMAADLLAALFWKAIATGRPGGIALQEAKVELAHTMMERTGYLDVEEQKTLTGFILYGDPAFPLLQRPRYADPEALRQLATKATKTSVYQISGKALPSQAPDQAVLGAVRQFTRPFLRGTRES
ncbi:MAG: C25 family cysteine peptidase, partial [Ardenticatenaceae bacterium]